MNKSKTTLTGTTEQAACHFNAEEMPQSPSTLAENKPDEAVIMHEAEIITPQPYGVYALCKIFERLQIN